MNEPDVVAVCCTHFPHLLLWERMEKPGVRTEVKNIHKEMWPRFCPILPNSSPKLLPLRDRYVLSYY